MKEKTRREKVLEILLIVLSIVLVFGGSYFASELKNCNSCETKEIIDLSLIKKVSVKNLKDSKEKKTFGDLFDSEEYSIVYLARPTCGHCQTQTPIMQSIADEKGIDIYYLNTDELKDDEFLQLFKVDTKLFGANGENFGTPTTVILQKGVVVDSIVGSTDKNSMLQLFSKYNLK